MVSARDSQCARLSVHILLKHFEFSDHSATLNHHCLAWMFSFTRWTQTPTKGKETYLPEL